MEVIEKPAKIGRICCGFCGKPHEEVKVIIKGPLSAICDECIELCIGIVWNRFRKKQ